MMYLLAFVIFMTGSAFGWLLRIWWLSALPTPRRLDPLDPDEYEKRRERLDRAYTESIREYDRLVTWSSGGALLVSVTFVEKLAPHPRPETAWFLSVGWALLAAGFLLSLASQYASSRVHSWRMNELDHLQKPAEERQEPWAVDAGRLARGARVWGKTTKWSTFLSGIVLVAGMAALAAFAFQNTPFASSIQ